MGESANYLGKLFEQAESARIDGRAKTAVGLYEIIVTELPFDDPLHIKAAHMLGVSLKMLGRYGASETVLTRLLKEADLERVHRGAVLRDLSDNFRLVQDFRRARENAIESFEVLVGADAPIEHRAATLGVLHRIYRDEGNTYYAVLHGDMARDMFAWGDNRPIMFYHAVELARTYALAGQAEKAKALVADLEADVVEYGSASHEQKLAIVLEYADSPDDMERRFQELQKTKSA